MDAKIIDAIVDSIINDLKRRSDKWVEIDPDIEKEIRGAWFKIIEGGIKN